MRIAAFLPLAFAKVQFILTSSNNSKALLDAVNSAVWEACDENFSARFMTKVLQWFSVSHSTHV
jgi:hypothetical protein